MTTTRPRTGGRGAADLLVVALAGLLVVLSGASPAAASGEQTPSPEPAAVEPSGEPTPEPAPEPEPEPEPTMSSGEAAALREDLVEVYALQAEFLALAGSTDPAMPSVEQYRSDVMAASDAELADVRAATAQLPQWPQLPAMLETMITSMPAGAAEALATGGSGTTVSSYRAMPTFDAGDAAPVAARSAASCEYDHIPAAAVFATQIILDVAVTAGELADLIFEQIDDKNKIAKGVTLTIAAVAKTVAGVAAIITDTLSYLRTLNNDCTFDDLHAFAKNIDNTTVATFNLVGSLGEAVARIESTSATTLLAVQDLDVDLSAFSAQVQETLQHNLTELRSSIGGSTQLTASTLQLLQAALQDGLVTLSDGVVAAKEEILTNDGATGSELEALLTDSLTRTIAELDRTTAEVRGRLDERTQLLMNAVEQDARTSRSEFSTDLRLSIEQAMTSGQRRTLLRLPAAKGGLLDARPIGVQSVVNEGMDAMLEIGAAIEPAAVKALNDGNQAIAEGRWLAAYGHFESAYQGMINAK